MSRNRCFVPNLSSARMKQVAEYIRDEGFYTLGQAVHDLTVQRDALEVALRHAADLRESDLDTADIYVKEWRELLSDNSQSIKGVRDE